MRDNFNLIDHINSFQFIYNSSYTKNISDIIFQGSLQSLLLDFQIIARPNLGRTQKDLEIYREYILQIISNSYQLIQKAKTDDERKIANFLFQSILSLEICKKLLK